MNKNYYFDTAIWVDFLNDRKGYNKEPLGEYAYKLILKIIKNNNTILISDVLLKELKTIYTEEEIKNMTNILKNSIKIIKVKPGQIKEAKQIHKKIKIPLGDILHAIIARDNEAILITRDKHFEKIKSIKEYYKPEELI